ncbi:polysaccharide pyruvyl transferase family protein [Niallia sp. 03133]|uniref:polysaccharide pyruvyl transferase family protein n=1 Tax=Niallia sp. 03133 TaxID=3458060 RepID=UPI004043C3BC
MKVALWGYYGTNYGDDIMMDVILRYFEKQGAHIKLIDIYNHNLQLKIQNKYKNIEVVNYYEYSKIKKLKIVKALAKYDINLWGGGTIFTDSDGDGNFSSFASIVNLGGKIGYIGVGIGSLNKKNRYLKTKYLLKRSKFTVFRDEISLKRAEKYTGLNRFKLAEDLAYMYFHNLGDISKYKLNNYVLVTWRNLIGYMSKDQELLLMDEVVEKVHNLMNEKNYSNVVLSALDTDFDIESCLILKDKFTKKGVEVYFDEDSSIENITNIIYNAQFHFSGRLHGSIASEFFKVPTLSLSYSPKIDYFYKSINSDKYYDIYSNNPIKDSLIEDIFKESSLNYHFEKKVENSMENFHYLREYLKAYN